MKGKGFRAWVLILVIATAWAPELVGEDKSGVKPESISLPTGPGSIEGLGESFEPQLNTGTATYSISIEVPPGVVGHQPDLGLSYNSGSGNSPFGIGWTLSVPAIQRQTDKGQPSYGAGEGEDTFLFQGEELVGLTNSTFRAENEAAFRQFRRLAGTEGWEVREKSGRILRFGMYPRPDDPDRHSRQVMPGTPGTFQHTFRWRLDEIEDVHGNLIEYFYSAFEDSPGCLYLRRIRYNLRSDQDRAERLRAPAHEVELSYSFREDPFSDYRSGFEIRTARRATRITVRTVVDPLQSPAGRIVRRYDLGYHREIVAGQEPPLPVIHSRLRKFTQSDAGGNELPPLRFRYRELDRQPTGQLQAVSGLESIGPAVAPGDVELIDLNSDALPDVLFTREDRHRYSLNLGGGRFAPFREFLNEPGIPGVTLSRSGVTLMDIDGDGITDLVHRRGGGDREEGVVYRKLRIHGKRGDVLNLGLEWGSEKYFRNGLNYPFESPHIRQLDLNFDKTVDLIRADDSGVRMILNLPGEEGDLRRWQQGAEISYGLPDLADLQRGFEDPLTSPLRPDPHLKFVDMNGDRLLDLVRLEIDGKFVSVRVWPGRGGARFATSYRLKNTGGFDSVFLEREPGSSLRLFDVTGDGLGDLVFPVSGKVRWWINLGGNRFSEMFEAEGPLSNVDTILREADLDGNGTTDLLWWNPSAAEDERMIFLSFIPGGQTGMLETIDNGIGKITTIDYETSTSQYLAAREAGDSWQTTLPFPISVVRRIRTTPSLDLDLLAGEDEYVTELFYGDGYYDGFEKEFRGFSRVVKIDRGDDRDAGLLAAGDVRSQTTITRHRFLTGAPDGIDNDGDRADLQRNGRDDDGDGLIDEADDGIDEFNRVAGREEEPLKGRPIWTETVAPRVTGRELLEEFDHDGDGRADWIRLLETGETDGVDNDLDGLVDAADDDESQYSHDDFVFSREFQRWNIQVLHDPGGGHELVNRATRDPLREVRFAFLEQVDSHRIEGPGRDSLEDGDPPSPSLSTRTLFRYDVFGNQVEKFEHGIYPDSELHDDERRRITEYAHGGQAIGRWILDRVARTYLTDEGGLEGRIIAEKRRYYGDDDADFLGLPLGVVGTRGVLKREQSVLIADTTIGQTGGDTHRIEDLRQSHDEYGNPRIILDPLGDPDRMEEGHAREVLYDPTFHTFPVTEILHVGRNASGDLVDPLILGASYDLSFGVLLESTDFNESPVDTFTDQVTGEGMGETARSVAGNVTRFDHDSHGRLVQIIRPGDSPEFPTERFSYHAADPSRDLIYSYERSGDLPGRAPAVVVSRFEAGGLSLALNSRASAVVTVARERAGVEAGLVSIRYSDGLGNELSMVTEDEEPGRFVIQKSTLLDSRGKTYRAFLPHYGGLAWERPPPNLAHMDSFRDAAGRVILTRTPPDRDGVRDWSQTLHLPFQERVLDAEDLRDGQGGLPLSEHRGTYHSRHSDGLGRLIEVQEAVRLDDEGRPVEDLRSWSTRYSYDLLDNLVHIKDSQDNEKFITFDSLGRQVFMDDPDRGVMDYVYDDASNLLQTVEARGQVTEYTYDGGNRLLTEDYLDEQTEVVRDQTPEDPDVVYHYDSPREDVDLGNGACIESANARGLLAWVRDLSGEEHRSYDERGRDRCIVKRISTQEDGELVPYRTEMRYDSLDRLSELIYPDGDQVSYRYNSRGLPEKILGGPSGSFISNVDYIPSEQIELCEFGNGVRRTSSYDPRLRMTSLHTARESEAASPLLAYSYTFDGSSNITRIDDRRPGDVVAEGDERRNTQIFEYDDLYRLSRVQYSFTVEGGNERDDGHIHYRYDRIGNMLEKSSNIEHNEQGRSVTHLGEMSYGGAAGSRGRLGRAGDDPGPHALTLTSTGRTYPYDANGNMEDIDGLQCTWDFKDRLIAVENDEVRADYRYDYTDRRIMKKVQRKGQEPLDRDRVTYVNRYFELRSTDVPVKYAWLGSTRVARFTGDPRSGVKITQKLQLFQGWNLVTLTVQTDAAFVQLGIGSTVAHAYLLNPETRNFEPLTIESQVPAGSVLWLHLASPATLEIDGTYPGATEVVIPTGSNFVSVPGLQAIHLENALPPEVTHAWIFDAENQAWRIYFSGVLASQSDATEVIAPDEVIFINATAPSHLRMPSRESQIRYFHQDHLGSSNVITDGEGQVAEELTYYPYGCFRGGVLGNGEEWYKFTQKEFDVESGLQHFEARYYAGEIGRFSIVDPVLIKSLSGKQLLAILVNPQRHNAYSYGLNNPLVYTDPDGEFAQFIVGAFIGAAIEVGVQVKMERKSYSDIDVGSVLISAAVGGATSGASALTAAKSVGSSVFKKMLGQGIVGAAGGASGSVAEQYYKKGSVDVGEVGGSALTGFLGATVAVGAGEHVSDATKYLITKRASASVAQGGLDPLGRQGSGVVSGIERMYEGFSRGVGEVTSQVVGVASDLSFKYSDLKDKSQ